MVKTINTRLLEKITERERTEKALRQSEARLKDAQRIAKLGHSIWDEKEDREVYWSGEWLCIFGLPQGRTAKDFDEFLALVHSDDRERVRAVMKQARENRAGFDIEYKIVRADGETRHAHEVAEVELDEAGELARTISTVQDITERKLAEEALQASEQRYRELFEESPAGIWETDYSDVRRMLDDLVAGGVTDLRKYFSDNPDKLSEAYDLTSVVEISHATCELFGAPNKQALIESTRAELETDEELNGFLGAIIAFMAGEANFDYEALDHKSDGTPIAISCRLVIPPKYRDDWSRVLYSVEDITDRKQAEEKLRESERRLQAAAKMAKLGYFLWDLVEDRCVYCSEVYARIHGMSVEEYMASTTSLKNDVRWVHPEDRARYLAAMKASLETGEIFELEYRILGKDGKVRYVREKENFCEVKDGVAITTEGTVQDITERVRAEEQLRQAQKMEAVGQLIGGVAHDFNNLLAVILGNAELLEERLGHEDTAIDAILRTATRGAELTQRLLAFSLQQSLSPQVIDLDALVSGMSEMLIRTLGETIEIETAADSDLRIALADPAQVENALLNLALNARDAMPKGGKLTIECQNAQLDEADMADNPDASAGDYVVLAVSDEGSGMTAEVQAHAFEPFFTTKEVGKGSGLGLSMVYGFANQSGGHVTIDSKPGRGTTVKLYLPLAEQAVRVEEVSRDVDIPRGEGEVILVIEDDPDVRALVVGVLEGLNYRVIGVSDAAAAHDALANGKSVDLVLSDVILPGGTSGPEFAEQACTTHPDLKIIFMSGYPAEAAKHNGFFGSDHVLLNKPFQRPQLATALRQMLD